VRIMMHFPQKFKKTQAELWDARTRANTSDLIL
jgi:hypothetical protein